MLLSVNMPMAGACAWSTELWHGDEQDSLKAGDVAFVPAGTAMLKSQGLTQLWVIHHRETGLSSQILTLNNDKVSV